MKLNKLKGIFSKHIMEIGSKQVNHFQDIESSIHDIKAYMVKFAGGSVSLDCHEESGIAIVTLDNSKKKKNAISGKMMVDLLDVVEKLEQWKYGKGIILKGNGETFCSGGDLDFAKKIGTPEDGFKMATFMHHILGRFQNLPMISVALIEGAGALGGGAEISTACDFRLITKNCLGIGFVHARMGIAPAWGGTTRLVSIVGYSKALDLLLTARILNPDECKQIQLVDEIISEENSEEQTLKWLQERTKFNKDVIHCLKQTTRRATCENTSSFEWERRLFAPLWGNTANREALKENIKHK